MNHADILKLLFPVELQGGFDADSAMEGKQLDAAQTSAETLLKEMFPEASLNLLSSWERVCGLSPAPNEPIQSRRDHVVQKLREHGGLSRAYYIALAAAMGYTITIEELLPFMCGWDRCGDPLYVSEVRWIWRVNVSGYPIYHFRAGQSAAGERLLWWPTQAALENILTDLKPAHTHIIFNYS